MRCTFSARFTAWNQVEKARTRSLARTGGRPLTRSMSSRAAASSPSRRAIAATRSCSTMRRSCGPPCSFRISPTSAPSACTSSRRASCLGGKWIWLRFMPRGASADAEVAWKPSIPPHVGLGGEVRALWPDNAEALTGRRLHHPPGTHLSDTLRSELLEPPHFGFDVIGFDVEMHSARVLDLLHLDVHLFRATLEHPIARLRRVRRRFHGVAEGSAPERSRPIEVLGPAVDDESREPTLVHAHLRLRK